MDVAFKRIRNLFGRRPEVLLHPVKVTKPFDPTLSPRKLEAAEAIRTIRPSEALLRIDCLAESDASRRIFRNYVQGIALEMITDGDWLTIYDQALDDLRLSAYERDLIVDAALEMQANDLRRL